MLNAFTLIQMSRMTILTIILLKKLLGTWGQKFCVCIHGYTSFCVITEKQTWILFDVNDHFLDR